MGSNFVKENTDSDIEIHDSDIQTLTMDNRTPPALRSTNVVDAACSYFNIKDSNFVDAFNYIEKADKISLIYFLYDDAKHALQDMNLIKSGANINIIQSWIESKPANYKSIIIETLSVIQDFATLKFLGLSKDDIYHFFPLEKMTTVYLNRSKKYLYRLFENLDIHTENKFLEYIYNDMIHSQWTFQKFPYLEMYFSYFEIINYISKTDLKNICKCLKYMELDIEYIELPTLLNGNPNTSDYIYDEQPHQSTGNNINHQNNSYTANDGSDKYNIDNNNPGICLIFDSERFYTEFDPKYKNLVIDPALKLENRTGTKKDSKRLQELFLLLNFRVIIHYDKTHIEIIQILNDTLNEVEKKDSSMFVILLSHGVEGKIIASNSIPVEVKQIKKYLMTCTNLNDKPKVLIMQSCQGNVIYSGNNIDENLKSDGPSSSRSNIYDVLEIWSTVPGYASIRNTLKGTWFIQSLCDVIENYSDKHLLDMCIITQNILKKKTGTMSNGVIGKMGMEYTCTFSKEFYFPKKKEIMF